MSFKCMIQGCLDTSAKLFPFPEDEQQFQKWVKILKEYQPIPEKRRHRKICEKHFLPNDFLPGRSTDLNLKPDAIPAVFSVKIEKSDSHEGFEFRHVDFGDIHNGVETPDIDENESQDGKANSATDESEVLNGDDSNSRTEPTNSSRCRKRLKTSRETFKDSGAESPLIFKLRDEAEENDSDYEPVREVCHQKLVVELAEKQTALQQEYEKLSNIEDLIKIRSALVQKLRTEFNRYEDPDVEFVANANEKANIQDYSNPELKKFSIASYHFSSSVYQYLCSLIPHLPSADTILDWVKSGEAHALFPQGVFEGKIDENQLD